MSNLSRISTDAMIQRLYDIVVSGDSAMGAKSLIERVESLELLAERIRELERTINILIRVLQVIGALLTLSIGSNVISNVLHLLFPTVVH